MGVSIDFWARGLRAGGVGLGIPAFELWKRRSRISISKALFTFFRDISLPLDCCLKS